MQTLNIKPVSISYSLECRMKEKKLLHEKTIGVNTTTFWMGDMKFHPGIGSKAIVSKPVGHEE